MEEYAVIFDLDGTLLNTLDDLYICFNYAIEKAGYPKRSIYEIKSFVGNGINKAIERALPNGISTEQFNKIVIDFKDYYVKHMLDHTKPYDGVIEMLEELKSSGYKTAVVSNKYNEAVKQLCSKYFDNLIDIAVGEGFGINKKPSSDGILKCINYFNINIKNTIYVGDSEVDIQTAQNAKIPCISVLWGFKDRSFLERNGGKIFAETPKDIIKIIEKKIYLR